MIFIAREEGCVATQRDAIPERRLVIPASAGYQARLFHPVDVGLCAISWCVSVSVYMNASLESVRSSQCSCVRRRGVACHQLPEVLTNT